MGSAFQPTIKCNTTRYTCQPSCSNGIKKNAAGSLVFESQMWLLAVQETRQLSFFTVTDHLVHNRNREPDRAVQKPAFLQKGKTKTSFWRNKMWTTANERVHRSVSGPYSKPWELSARYDVPSAAVTSCSVSYRQFEAANIILHFALSLRTIAKLEIRQTEKIHNPVPQILLSNFQPQKILEAVVYTRCLLSNWTSQQYVSVSVDYERSDTRQNSKCK